MSVDLMSSLKDMFTPMLMDKLGGLLGENQGTVQKAVTAAVPSILAGLMQTGANNPSTTERILGLVRQEDLGGLADKIGGMLGGGGSAPAKEQIEHVEKTGGSILSMIFGDKLAGLLSMLGGLTGMKGGGLSSLLGLIAPLILGKIGKVLMSGGGLNVSSLMSLLSSNKDAIAAAAPAGLTNLLGINSFASLGNKVTDAAKGAAYDAGRVAGRAADDVRGAAARTVQTAEAGLPSWLLPLLGLVGLGLLGWYFLSGTSAPENVDQGVPVQANVPPDPAARTQPEVKPITEPVRQTVAKMTSLTLPDGTSVDVAEGGALANLGNYLTTMKPDDPPRTFVLEGLEFEGTTANPSATSQGMIQALAEILAAFSAAKLQIVGHTDATADPATDEKISNDRANKVKDTPVTLGVPADRLVAEGQGGTKPIAPNDNEVNRAKNRRTELAIVK